MKKFLLVLVAFMTVIFTGCANKEVKNQIFLTFVLNE